MRKCRVVLLGPSLHAASGVSTHLNQILGSALAREFELRHFHIGSEGRPENGWQRIMRFVVSPLAFTFFLLVHRPRIVHLNTSMETRSYWRDAVYMVLARALGRRIVYQMHGGALPREFFRGSAFLTACLHRVLSIPHVIVLLGNTELAAYREFVPTARLVVIPNAISKSEMADDAESATAAGPLHLVYVGRLAREKGIFEIVEAARILRDRGIHVRTSIAGSGPEESRLRAATVEAGLTGEVELCGPVFGDRKIRLWQGADVFVFPTFHREGLPYALLEGMAAGAVPITTATGAISDVMQNEVHGLIVPAKDPVALADAVVRLDADRAHLARMALAGRQQIRAHYTVDRLTGDFSSLYASLC